MDNLDWKSVQKYDKFTGESAELKKIWKNVWEIGRAHV